MVAGVLAIFLLVQSAVPSQVNQGRNAALNGAVGTWSKDGGVIQLGSTRFCDSFDPAKSFDQWCGVVFRMYARNLMAFQGQAGSGSLQVAPDLASARPKVSADKTTWTFTLRRDVKWNDGTSLSTSDVRYSIERLYDPKIFGAVNTNYLCLLTSCTNGIPSYKGLALSKGKHLTSVVITDARTITFKLNSPFVDFDKVLAIPQFSIVERFHDLYIKSEKRTYADKPSSSGPYVLSRDRKRNLVTFTRNVHWNQSQDPVRSPHVEKYVWRLFPSEAALDKATVNQKIDLQLSGGLGLYGLTALDKNRQLFDKVDIFTSGYVNYLAIGDQVKPLDKIECRKAIFYGINKSSLQKLRGGEYQSRIATSLLPPTIEGYDSRSNLYPSGDANQGDLNSARTSLNKCGYPDGFEMVVGYLNTGIGSAIVRNIQISLARIGVVVVPKPFDTYSKYVSVTQSPDQMKLAGISALISGNNSMIHSAYDFWTPIVDGRLIMAFNNQNLAQISDSNINNNIDQLTLNPAKRVETSAVINDQVMKMTQYLPYAYDQHVLFRSSRLANVYIQQGLDGQYDLVNLAVKAQ